MSGRPRTIAALVAGLLVSLSAAAPAAGTVGDLEHLSLAPVLSGDAESVEVNGAIRCAAMLDYGLWVKVVQPAVAPNPRADSPVEGVGALGPTAPPLQDDQPCGTELTDFDVVVQRNRGSDSFSDSGAFQPPRNMTVLVVAGASTGGGTRGPGPVIGDLEFLVEDVSFTLP